MVVLVDIIEERSNGESFISTLKQYADRIVAAGIDDPDLLFLCSQAYILSGEFGRAMPLISSLVEKFPEEIRYEKILMLCIDRMGDEKAATKYCERIVKKNWEKTDYQSLYSCAQACLIAKDYKNCAYFAEKANTQQPNDISCLQKLCSAYLHLGDLKKAIQAHKEMVKVDAQSNFTINLGRSIATVINTHKSAQNGDAEAQFYLFAMYIRGDAVPQDQEKAMYWLQKAAEQNHPKAIEFYKKFA
jgi:tetratricopeptide (TPR) repeat protein